MKILPKARKNISVIHTAVTFIIVSCISLHLCLYVLLYLFETDKILFSDNFIVQEMQIINEPIIKRMRTSRVNRNFYYIDIMYKYNWHGKLYVNNRVSFGNMSLCGMYNSIYEKEMNDVVEYILDKKIVYIDPNNPSYSVLVPKKIYMQTHIARNKWYSLDISIICLVVVTWASSLTIDLIRDVYQKSGKVMNQYFAEICIITISFLAFICVLLLTY